jgi:hypothetical protein
MKPGGYSCLKNGGRIEVLPVLSIFLRASESTHTDRTLTFGPAATTTCCLWNGRSPKTENLLRFPML